MNIGVHVSFQIMVFSKCMLRNGISGRYGSSVISFLRTLHTVLPSSYTNLHSHQQYRKVLFFPHLCQHLLFVDFLMTAILTSVKSYCIVVLICISLIIGDNEHLFICFLAICLLWRNVCLDLLPIFWLGCLFVCYWVTQALCVFWRLIFCHLLNLHILSPILRAVFSFCLCFLCCAKAFTFS